MTSREACQIARTDFLAQKYTLPRHRGSVSDGLHQAIGISVDRASRPQSFDLTIAMRPISNPDRTDGIGPAC